MNCCKWNGLRCLLLCDSCFSRLAALQEALAAASQSAWSLGSVPCPSEREALRRGEDAFLWFLWFPVFFGRREETTGAQIHSSGALWGRTGTGSLCAACPGVVPAARLPPVLPLGSLGSLGGP